MVNIGGLKCIKVKITIDNKEVNGFIYRDNDLTTQELLCKKSVLYEYEHFESEYITSISNILKENKTITIKNYG